MNFILTVFAAIVAAITLAYPFVSIVNLIGLAVVFCPKDSRDIEIAHFRELGTFAGYSDWQIIALLILLAIFPYFNLALFSSTLTVTCEQITQWLEPFGKKRG